MGNRIFSSQSICCDNINRVNVLAKGIFNTFYLQMYKYSNVLNFTNDIEHTINIGVISENSYCSIACDAIGNVYVSYVMSGDILKIIVIKYDKSGNIMWTTEDISSEINIGDTNNEHPSIGVDLFGNAYIAYSTTEEDRHIIAIIKLDENGNLLWRTTSSDINPSGDNICPYLTVDERGYICIAFQTDGVISGGTKTSLDGNYDIIVMRMNFDGIIMWILQKPYFNTPQNNILSHITTDEKLNTYVCYVTQGRIVGGSSYSNSSYDITIFKISEIGNFLWIKQEKDFNSFPQTDIYYPTIAIHKNILYISNTTTVAMPNNIMTGTKDVYIAKLDANYGNFISVRQEKCLNILGSENNFPIICCDKYGIIHGASYMFTTRCFNYKFQEPTNTKIIKSNKFNFLQDSPRKNIRIYHDPVFYKIPNILYSVENISNFTILEHKIIESTPSYLDIFVDIEELSKDLDVFPTYYNLISFNRNKTCLIFWKDNTIYYKIYDDVNDKWLNKNTFINKGLYITKMLASNSDNILFQYNTFISETIYTYHYLFNYYTDSYYTIELRIDDLSSDNCDCWGNSEMDIVVYCRNIEGENTLYYVATSYSDRSVLIDEQSIRSDGISNFGKSCKIIKADVIYVCCYKYSNVTRRHDNLIIWLGDIIRNDIRAFQLQKFIRYNVRCFDVCSNENDYYICYCDISGINLYQNIKLNNIRQEKTISVAHVRTNKIILKYMQSSDHDMIVIIYYSGSTIMIKKIYIEKNVKDIISIKQSEQIDTNIDINYDIKVFLSTEGFFIVYIKNDTLLFAKNENIIMSNVFTIKELNSFIPARYNINLLTIN